MSKIEVSVEYRDGNKLSAGNNVVCFMHEYVLFLLSAVTVLDLSVKCRS